MSVSSSSAYYTNALTRGASWTGSAGAPANISYSYNVQTRSVTSDAAREVLSPGAFSSAQRTGMEQALQAWENIANINFTLTETTSSSAANLIIRQADLPAGVAGWLVPTTRGSTITSSDLVIDNAYNPSPTVGSYSYKTMMHEVGHAIGLKHPGDYGDNDMAPFLPAAEDSRNASIMSYNNGSLVGSMNNSTTPMIYDIAAAQHLYGANTSYNAGDNSYDISGAVNAMTIWDGNGNDTINSSSYAGSATIDLREGLDLPSIVGNTIMWIAFNANIENATAGVGQDTLYGNGLNNVLYGGAGSDSLYGNEGSDITYGNQDADAIYGGAGIDALYGGKGNDTIIGGSAVADGADSSDTIWGGESNDLIYGNAGNDLIIGGTSLVDPFDGADTIYAGSGDDTVYSNGGDDVLYGNAGNDALYAGAGNNIYAFNINDGADTIMQFSAPGIDAGDMVFFSAALFASAAGALAATSYNESGAVIILANGSSITMLGVTAWSLTANDFFIF